MSLVARAREYALPLLLLTSCVGLSAGCTNRYTIPAGAPTYAADAKVAVSVNKTGVRQVRIKVVHLAPLKRIDPTYSAYVVWFSVPGQGITRAGSLSYSEKWRTGKLLATTPHPKFELIITIEQNASTQQPSDKVIARRVVSKV
ncbi:MAG: hypothetical protein H6713_19215 [Myxococcales bacterium]|nr:hypothetical protein [Myxococcales bacterium]MCB9752100.1 hypothetical protein [Myxococcales bacterium]